MRTRLPALILAAMLPLVLLLLAAIAIPDAEAASTWIVGVDPECPTIQACIDHASILDGDTVYLPTGTYTEQLSVHKELSFLGDGMYDSVITADEAGRVVYVPANSVTFEDLTIADGRHTGAPARGGGIYARQY